MIQFQENQPKVKALIDSNSKVNVMTSAYATKLGFTIWKTSIGAKKIDGSLLETYSMVPASFLLQDSLGKVQFLEKTFLLTNISMEMILKIPFLSYNNTDVEFAELEKLIWRSYMAAEALSIPIGWNSLAKENLLKQG